MRKVLIVIIVAILAVPFILGYLYIHNLNNNGKTNIEKTPQLTTEPSAQYTHSSIQNTHSTKAASDPIQAKIDTMTLSEKIGQLVIVGMDGYTLDEHTTSMIKDYKVGGFILYSLNVKDSAQLLALINSLKQANGDNAAPLFMSVDQEGGRIERLPVELRKFPTNKAIGQKSSGTLSYNIGRTIAEEIKAFGFNLDFAPVMDINSNPNNPVIGDRSFGPDAQTVSKLGVQTMKGIQSGGIIPVVKHFPGHGDTSVDSHIGLPVVYNDVKRLESFEFIPFANAIKNNADAVLIAHILLPEIDPDNPATFSKFIITDTLWKKLGFEGVVITDDMTMGAIVANYDIGVAAVKSINAGSDIILVAHNFDQEVQVINALKKAAEDNTVSKQRIDESVYRVLKLKAKYHLADKSIGTVNVKTINDKIDAVLSGFPK